MIGSIKAVCVRCTQPGMPLPPPPPPAVHFRRRRRDSCPPSACLPPCLAPVAAERVKVFVRIRPTKAEGETSGGLRPKADGRGVVIYRE